MAGTLVVVAASRVEPLAADSANVMALIVSGGVSRASSVRRVMIRALVTAYLNT